MSDQNPLLQHYQSLTPESIKEEIQLMKEAKIHELYSLIAADCLHFVSIIVNYKEEDLQSLCQMRISSDENHLSVAFRLHNDDPWTEVMFSTIEETLIELKRMIELQLQTYYIRSRKLSQQCDPTEESFPKITDQQRLEAGYKRVPQHLLEVEKQLRNLGPTGPTGQTCFQTTQHGTLTNVPSNHLC